MSGGGEIITSNDSISDATTIHAMANCGAFGSATNFSAGASPAFVLVGDFNADGKRDMAVANSGSNNVSILLGNGSGGFAAAVNYAAGAQPSGLAKADFNGDGKIDLAVTNAGASSVSILLGNGNGTFGTPTDYGTGTGPAVVVMADFDGDGKADLAVANRGSDNISILLGNGNGTFSAAQNYGSGGLGAQSIALATGDFNSDGKIDLAVANWGANNVSIFLGAGDGTFASAVNYSTGPYPSSIAIDDFNGDGKADLVLGSETPGIQGTMTVLLGIGDGTFVLHAQYPAGMQSRSVVSGDFNGDKKADLAFANNGAGDVSIFFGNGDATFAGPTNYNVQSSPTHIAVSDFNGDGKADLAVVNNGSGSVSLLLASCPVDLSITKSHTGNFTQGQTGATYTITATNSAASNPTSGTVTVTDSLPAGLTATGIAGTGWSCALAALTCTRSDALTGGAIYPPITVTVSVNSNAAATVINTATISGGGDQSAGNNTASNPTTINPSAGLIAPTNLVAIATSTTNISLTWNAVTNAASYQVFRSSNNGGYAQVGTPSGAAFNDTVTNINPTTYLYRVQAVDASNNVGPQSNIGLATTIVFTDDPLTSGLTFIKATHIAQLRIAVDAVRSAAGLAAATYTYPATAGTVPHAFDITELRTALDAARNAIFGASGLVYTDSTITPGVTTMKTAHIQELRSGVK